MALVLGISILIYAYWLFVGAYIEYPSAPIWAKALLGILGVAFSVLGLFHQSIHWESCKSIGEGRLEIKPIVQFVLFHGLALILVSVIAIPIQRAIPDSYLALSNSVPLRFSAVYLVLSLALALCLIGWGNKQEQEESNKGDPYFAYFIIVYFLLLAAPYAFAQVEGINAALTTAPGIYIYRGITSALLIGYAVYLSVRYDIKLQWGWAFLLGLFILNGIVGLILAPRDIQIGSFHSVIDSLSIWVELARIVLSCATLYIFVAIFPNAIRSRRDLLIPLAFIVAFVLICCIYSYITEAGEYYSYITATRTHKQNIRAFFQSKNDFGMFLFFGSFCSLFLLYNIKAKCRYIFLGTFIVFFITSGLIQCYTAFIPSLVMALGLIALFCGRTYKTNKALSLGAAGGVSVLILVAVLCLFIEGIYSQVPLFDALHTQVLHFFNTEIATRTDLWGYVNQVINGGYAYIGKTEVASGQTLLGYLSRDDHQYLVTDFHSSYVSMLATRGLVGVLIYASVLGFALKKVIKADKALRIPLLILFVACLLNAMPETYTLGLSMSLSALPFGLVFLAMPKERKADA